MVPVTRGGVAGYRLSLVHIGEHSTLRLEGSFFAPQPLGASVELAPERRAVAVPKYLMAPPVDVERTDTKKGNWKRDKNYLQKNGWTMQCGGLSDPNLYLVWNGRSIVGYELVGKTRTMHKGGLEEERYVLRGELVCAGGKNGIIEQVSAAPTLCFAFSLRLPPLPLAVALMPSPFALCCCPLS